MVRALFAVAAARQNRLNAAAMEARQLGCAQLAAGAVKAQVCILVLPSQLSLYIVQSPMGRNSGPLKLVGFYKTEIARQLKSHVRRLLFTCLLL